MTGGAAVRLEGLGFSYGQAAMAFDLDIAPGRIVAVMGPSGAGKSTLLNLVAGFETPATGRILIGGRDVTVLPPSQRPVSMIFQENNLFAHLTVEKNVGLGISPSLRLSAADRLKIAGALERTGLAGMAGRLPRELSGGERQRAALARILVREQPVLLLDEPLASLGPALRREMLDLVGELHAERRPTLFLVSHYPDDARRIAEYVVFVEDGKISAEGEAEQFFEHGGPAAFRRYVRGDDGTVEPDGKNSSG